MKSRIGKKIGFDDGGDVLVIGDMLGEDHEGHRDVGNGDGGDIRSDVADFAVLIAAGEGGQEGELRIPLHACELREVDDLHGGDVGGVSDDREDRGQGVARADADDEGDHLQELLAVDRAEHGHEEGDESAQQAEIRGGVLL